jgi:tetratricopeptide (TPR) repeat protein
MSPTPSLSSSPAPLPSTFDSSAFPDFAALNSPNSPPSSTPSNKRYLLLFGFVIAALALGAVFLSFISPISRQWASDARIDKELEPLLASCRVDETDVDFQADIANCERAIALNFARTEPDEKLHAKLLYDLMENHYWAKNYNLAKTYGLATISLHEAIKASDDEAMKRLSKAYNTVGRAFYYGSYSKKDQLTALTNYGTSIALLRKISPLPEDELGSRINNQGAAYYSLSQYEDAYVALSEALVLREKTSDALGGEVAETVFNLAMTLEELKKYNEADTYWKRVVHIYDNHTVKDGNHNFLKPATKVESYISATNAQLDRPKANQDLKLALTFMQSAKVLADKGDAKDEDVSTIDRLTKRIKQSNKSKAK